MKILLILIAVAIALALFLRRRPARPPGKAAAKKSAARVASASGTQPAEFRSTSIKPGVNACDAATRLEGKRHLLSEVPTLPLGECDAAACDCRYGHHDDRREPSQDRRAVAGLSAELYADSGNKERRENAKGVGRRNSDRRA